MNSTVTDGLIEEIFNPVDNTDLAQLDAQLDPMDEPAAILFLVFSAILSITPVTFYYAAMDPIVSTWSAGYNGMYKASWYTLWISNIILYGIPAVFGGFTWLWNAYIVGGYVAWNQYLVVWGGSIMQVINLGLLIAGAATYDETSSIGGLDTELSAWLQFTVWFVVTAGVYVGYWLLNDNFLAYYVIEELIHKLKPSGDTSVDQLGAEEDDFEFDTTGGQTA